jgi:cell wall-associated NlpC family hydrolase
VGRSSLRALGVAAMAIFVSLLPMTAAHAAPDVAAIEKQIEETWAKLEPTIEQYNNIHNQLKKNQAKSADLGVKIQPLQLQVDLALSRVGELAAQFYKGGGNTSAVRAILSSGSPTNLAEQLALLDQLAKSQRDQISAVTEIRDKYDGEKRQLDDLIKLQAAQDADLAGKKKTIESELNRLNGLRVQAYGSSTVGGSLRVGPCPAVYIGGAAGTAVKTACAQIGKSYIWAANGPDHFDCSGLTQYAWGKAGVSLTHYTGAQWKETTSVPASQARPGDLVFFYSDLHHVGMYVGNGIMVHAPHAGDVVRMKRISEYGVGVAGYRRP